MTEQPRLAASVPESNTDTLICVPVSTVQEALHFLLEIAAYSFLDFQ